MTADRSGILLMIGAFALFAVLDASAKLLTASYPTLMVVWVRFALAFAVTALVLTARRGPRIWRPARPGLQWLRSSFLLAATGCNFVAVQYLQLAQTAAILFAAPMFVGLLAYPLLGERVGRHRWYAIAVGFLGVLVVIRPGLGVVHWAAIFSVGTAFATALYQITTRKLAGTDEAATTQLFTAIAGGLALTPLVPLGWQTPQLADVPLFLLLGACGGLGHVLLVVAHQRAPAPVLAPFMYSEILLMVLLGWLVFGDVPDLATVIGASIVVASGLYLLAAPRVSDAAGSPRPADPGPRR